MKSLSDSARKLTHAQEKNGIDMRNTQTDESLEPTSSKYFCRICGKKAVGCLRPTGLVHN
jgi:hypothetical protein